jgi:hypothetical protein
VRENLKFAVESRIVTVEGLHHLCGFFWMNLRALDDEGIDRFQDQAPWGETGCSELLPAPIIPRAFTAGKI